MENGVNKTFLVLIIILAAAFSVYYFINLLGHIISTQPTPQPTPTPIPQPQAYGILTGKMTIGPICPVERIDNPCLPTPEMYAARVVSIYSPDHSKIIATTSPNANGFYFFRLPVGNYILDMEHSGVGRITGAPSEIKISKNATSTQDIDVDTGIR